MNFTALLTRHSLYLFISCYKVENASDFRLWPRSRINLPDPANRIHVGSPLSSQALTHDVDSHINLVVAELKSQLCAVRDSYQRLGKASSLRIAELEAQVARRETELEYAVMFNDHHKQATLLSASSNSHNNVHLSPRTVNQTLESKVWRNNLLANEVSRLQDKVMVYIRMLLQDFYSITFRSTKRRTRSLNQQTE